jgi:alpha-methylacyl-CoA racemase
VASVHPGFPVSRPNPEGPAGPLAGLSVLELAGQGPGPFAGMLLADMGATVVKVDRVEQAMAWDRERAATDLMDRGKRSVALDLRHSDGAAVVLRLVERCDVIIDPFRPGVVERLGIGPDPCLAANPALIFARMTGWGQEGPWAQRAGHDINYISLPGALDLLGEPGRAPQAPLNILGDFAGGGILLAFGIVCAAYEARTSGRGQVIDAAMVDGSALVMAPFIAGSLRGQWGPRGANFLDGAAHFYGVYRTADSRYISVAAIEPKFYAQLLDGLGLDPEALGPQWDRDRWPSNKEAVAAVVASRTQDEWSAVFDGTDACFCPVLTPEEAVSHSHIAERGTFVDVDGLLQPGPAPRFSRTATATPKGPCFPGQHTEQILADAGLTAQRIEELQRGGVVA